MVATDPTTTGDRQPELPEELHESFPLLMFLANPMSYDMNEVARRLMCDRATVRAYIADGELETWGLTMNPDAVLVLKRQVRISSRALADFIMRQEQAKREAIQEAMANGY